jgi:serine phosphatase RsbU (regulator of sigma subunit)
MTANRIGRWMIGGGIVAIAVLVLTIHSGLNAIGAIVGLFLLTVFNFGFAMLFLKESREVRVKRARLYLVVGCGLLIAASTLRLTHTNGAATAMLLSGFFLSFAFLPLLIRNRYEKWLRYADTTLLILTLVSGDLVSGLLLILGVMGSFIGWTIGPWMLIGGIVSMAVTLVSWNYVFQIIVRKRKEAEDRATAANRELTDSITYAKRLQTAMLPDARGLQKLFPESFILFRPKVIVSGDFYFFEKHNDNIVLAAADCTGHGVPGAFMSVLGVEKLKEAAASHSDPSGILSALNRSIKTSLNQSDNEDSTRDGLDIALCSIHPDSGEMRYAGAYRPLWIVRSGAAEVEEIKATKKAIGGLTDENQLFESHTVNLLKGDTIYLFSDGYADTFNGVTGKKLMTKHFRELLLSVSSEPMPRQKERLESFIEEWMGGAGPVDDMLVIGVRV